MIKDLDKNKTQYWFKDKCYWTSFATDKQLFLIKSFKNEESKNYFIK